MPDQPQRNPTDAWIEDKFRPFVRGWLEIVRNLLVVVIFNALAQKTHYGLLQLFAFVTMILFGYYCVSYIQLAIPAYRSTAPNKWLRYFLNVVSFAFAVFVIWSWSNVMQRTFSELGALQPK
jgi:uncharacterized membrane protein HdeD (DUF308 family)